MGTWEGWVKQEHLDDIQRELMSWVMRMMGNGVGLVCLEGKNLRSTNRKQKTWISELSGVIPFLEMEGTISSLRIERTFGRGEVDSLDAINRDLALLRNDL